jgi:very-short-patch-repair endonuclease
MVAADFAPSDVIEWRGLPVTRPLRTGLDLARRHGRTRASALVPLCGGVRMEIALRSGLVDPGNDLAVPSGHALTNMARWLPERDDVMTLLRDLVSRVNAHGMRWVWHVLPDVEPLVETVLEALAWAHLTESRLPRPLPQEWVRGASGRNYRVDFLIGDRVILEADGAVKYADQTPWQEKQRQSDIEAAGYWVVRCTWEELMYRPHEVLVRIARALQRAA